MSADRLMTSDQIANACGLKTAAKQVEWFRTQFGINVVRDAKGRPVMTWSTFEALLQKRAGISSGVVEPSRPALRPVNTRASR
jgi:hypothetical protein